MTRPDRGLQERCLFIVTVLMRCRCLESELWGKGPRVERADLVTMGGN